MGKKNVELAERRRSNMDAKHSSTSSLPSLSAPEELQLDLRPAPAAEATTITTTVEVENQATENDEVQRPSQDVDQMKNSEKTIVGSKENVGDATKEVVEKAVGQTTTVVGDGDKKDSIKPDTEVDSQTKTVSDPEKESHESQSVDEASKPDPHEHRVESEKLKISTKPAEVEKIDVDKNSAEAVDNSANVAKEEEANKAEDATQPKQTEMQADVEIRETSGKDSILAKSSRDSVESKESEGEKTIQKDEVKYVQEEKVAIVEEGPQVIQGPPVPASAINAQSQEQQKDSLDPTVSDKKDMKKTVKFAEEKEPAPEKVEEPEAKKTPHAPSSAQEPVAKEPSLPQQKPKPKKYEYRKAPNPPFVSTSLLKPMKADPPKPRPVMEKSVEEESPQQETERWRELEEELLGRGKI